MKTSKLLKWVVAATLALTGLSGSAYAQGTLPLVSGTNFEVEGAGKNYYKSVDEITGWLGVIRPTIGIVDFTLVDTTNADKDLSHFLSEGTFYGINNSSIRLDSLRLKEDDGWGMVLSGGKAGINYGGATVMNLSVSGLKPGGAYRVEIDYESPLIADYAKTSSTLNQKAKTTKRQTDEIGGLLANVNCTATNWKAGEKLSTSSTGGQTLTLTSSNDQTTGAIGSDGTLNLKIGINSLVAHSAIKIKEIRVYASVAAKVVGPSPAEVCAGGEEVRLSVDQDYLGATYKWLVNGKDAPGDNKGSAYLHKSALEMPENTTSIDYTYSYQIIKDGKVVLTSEAFKLTDIVCCMEGGKPTSRRLIWQDDFGTFTSPTEYWNWDYSNPDEPKKVKGTTTLANRYEYCRTDEIPGAECSLIGYTNGYEQKFGEGKYTYIAKIGRVNGNYTDNAGIGWVSQTGDGQYPDEVNLEFFPDNTYPDGSQAGACLMLNCGNPKGATIYKRHIPQLCEKTVTVKCYINTFSKSGNPVSIQVKVTDVESGKSAYSEPVTKYSNKGRAWVPVQATIDLTGTEMEFEIISFVGDGSPHDPATTPGTGQSLNDPYNNLGNDLLLDDIQIWGCSAPPVDLFFNHLEVENETCKGDTTELHVNVTDAIKTYYGSDSPYFIYQYSTKPADKDSWKSLNDSPTDKDVYKDLSDLIKLLDLKTDDKVFFRVVMGTQGSLNTALSKNEVFNPNKVCSDYVVSDTIKLTIKCADCTDPNDIELSAKVDEAAAKPAPEVIKLCVGQSVTLSTNDLKPTKKEDIKSEDFKGFTIKWYKDDELQDDLTETPVTTTTNTITYKATDAPGKYVWKVVATDPFPGATCEKEAKVTVEFLKKPEVDDLAFEFCEKAPDASKDKLPTAKTGETYTYFETEDDATAGTPDFTIADFKTLAVGEYNHFYTLTDANGCVSDPGKVDIAVREVPTFEVPAITPPSFCAGQYMAAGETEPNADYELMKRDPNDKYDITWTAVSEGASTKVNTMKGNTSAYAYKYVVSATYGDLVCKAKEQDYSVKVDPAVVIEKLATRTDECDLYVLDVVIDPADAEKEWTGDGFDVDDSFSEKWEKAYVSGKITLTASKEGYCDVSKDLAVTTRKSPVVITANPVTMVKMLQYKQPKTLREACSGLSPDLAVDDANLAKDLELVYTQSPLTAEATTLAEAKALTYSSTEPKPQATPAGQDGKFDAKKEVQYYYIRVHNKKTDCYSDPILVIVTFYGAPIPEADNSHFCKGVETAKTLDKFVRTTKASDTDETVYTLHYYKADKTTELTDLSINTSTEGETQYWATQSSVVEGEYSESEAVPFTVTVYGVAAPTIDQTQPHYVSEGSKDKLYYCLNDDDVSVMKAVEKVDEANYLYSSGMEWSKGSELDDNTRGDATMKPSVDAVGETDYFVRQYYKITSAGFEAVCVGKSTPLTVVVEKTDKPAITDVTYLYSDYKEKATMNSLEQQEPNLITDADKDDYIYEYAELNDAGDLTSATSWSAGVPVPEKIDPNGASVTKYYAVRKTAKSGAKCTSEPTLITVTFSDSPMPVVKALQLCEGQQIPSLYPSEYVKIGEGLNGYDKFDLLWIDGTNLTSAPKAADFESVTANNTPTLGTAAVKEAGKTAEYVYYIAQKDKNEPYAIGAPSKLVITVYPNPVVTTDEIEPVCEKTVDLGNGVIDVKAVSSVNNLYYKNSDGTEEIRDGKVSESGTYYCQVWMLNPGNNPVSGNEFCKSTIEPIKVTIDELEITSTPDSTTCPDTKGALVAKIKTNVSKATFEWTAQDGTSGNQTDNDETTGTSKFISKALPGNADDVYMFDLKVTAGSCTDTKTGIKITLGDGPVDGTLTLAETNNKMSGKAYSDNLRNVTSDPFYMCGDGVKATADFKKDSDSDFKWYDANEAEIDANAISKAGVYTLKYSNNCATSVTFEIKDASITNNLFSIKSGSLTADENNGELLSICEKEPIDFNLTYNTTKSDEFEIVWTKDGSATDVVKNDKGSIAYSKPENSGEYTYVINNKGCSVTGSVSVLVKPFIKFTPENDYYVARRDSALEIKIDMEVPTSEPDDITWTSSNSGSVVATTKDYTYVTTATDIFKVHMAGTDFCPADTVIKVQMDGRLEATSQLDEKMCKDDVAYLTIDTAGTGKLVYPNLYRVVVVEKIGEVTREISDSKKKIDIATGVISYEVSPKSTATYTTKIYYREGEGVDEQYLELENTIEILQKASWQYSPDYAVCAGDELKVDLVNVKPEGAVTIVWDDDADIVSSADSSIVISPAYNEDKAKNHKFTKRYSFTVLREGCADKRDSVPVKVWEPITGSMNDTIICEGFGVRLNATNYQASTYEWTTPLEAVAIAKTPTAYVIPERTAYYIANMTRGECKLADSVEVTVNSKPQINLVDSTGIHQLTVAMEPMNGTAPFMYRVDNGEYVDSEVLDSVAYHHHVIYVKDAAGCMDTTEYYLNPPKIVIPIWFSPNGDGDYDRWEVPTLTETYPSAEIKIFDRWGKLLVRYKGSEPGWDGTYNGQDMPSTDYWYEIHIREIDTTYTGHFTLLRR